MLGDLASLPALTSLDLHEAQLTEPARARGALAGLTKLQELRTPSLLSVEDPSALLALRRLTRLYMTYDPAETGAALAASWQGSAKTALPELK